MSNVIDFKPKEDLAAIKKLEGFITWAQETLPKGIPDRVHPSIRWDLNSWHRSGMTGTTFTALDSPRYEPDQTKRYMQSPYIDFAKAVMVHRCVFQGKKDASNSVFILKVLEAALLELTGTRDVTLVSPAVCDRACDLFQKHRPGGDGAYRSGIGLKNLLELMEKKGLVASPFRWKSPLKLKKKGNLENQKADRINKLPSRGSLQALGELFNNNPTNPLDIVVTSACALLLSQPSRVGELANVEHDCIVFKEGVCGGHRMFLRWNADKGFGAKLVPVVTGMEPVVKLAIERILKITKEAREYAAWLEDHPDNFPPHEGLPDKGLDEPLSYAEACSALKRVVKGRGRPRGVLKRGFIDPLIKRKSLSPAAKSILNEIINGWDASGGKMVIGRRGRFSAREYNDNVDITLRKLNVLVRELYLPASFPYTTPNRGENKRVKYRDALFTVRTGALVGGKTNGARADFGVEIAASVARMAVQLSLGGPTKSIFERYGYKGVGVNTHAFRHELNTEMHRAGLSQLLIDAFSGRTSMGAVYNHETVEERTQRVANFHPKTKESNAVNRLEKLRTNAPLSLTDVTELAEGTPDRVIHQTHVGLCVHNFASEPCPKMGACLSCGNLACVKGDEEKLKNLKEERSHLQKRCSDALRSESEGLFGASEWVTKVRNDLFKCDELIKLLENPELENGAIVWNADSGWNLTNNAAAMAGLVAPQVAEANAQEALTSLDELSAMMDDIEE